MSLNKEKRSNKYGALLTQEIEDHENEFEDDSFSENLAGVDVSASSKKGVISHDDEFLFKA